MSKPLLSFRNTKFNIINRNGEIWLTSGEVAQALGYSHENSVTRIYARNSDEFTERMSQKVNLTLSGNYQKEVRIFSLRGAHMVGMLARTPVAKDFRKWVLDVLDKSNQISDEQIVRKELRTIRALFTVDMYSGEKTLSIVPDNKCLVDFKSEHGVTAFIHDLDASLYPVIVETIFQHYKDVDKAYSIRRRGSSEFVSVPSLGVANAS